MHKPVVLLVVAAVLQHQVVRAAPPNAQSRTIVLISPSWPVFFPFAPPPPPPADDGPQSRSPQHPIRMQPQFADPLIPVHVLVLDPTRSVASTIQGYVSQATGFVTNSITNGVTGLLPNLPLTVNIPDIFTGVANRVNAAATAVQTAWQNRPAANPTSLDPPPDRFPDPDHELII